MKKITLSLILLVAILVLPSVIFAAEGNVAKIGDTEYATLQDAIDTVPADTQTTIMLIRDVEDGTGIVTKNGQNIIIDFNKKSYDASNPLVGSDGTKTNGFQLLKGSTVTLKNGTLTSDGTAETGPAKILIQNYSDLTVQDMTIKAENTITQFALSNNCGIVNIIGNTSISVTEDNYAFDMCWGPNVGYPEGTQITVNTTGEIKGNIQLAHWGTIYEDDLKNITSTLTINKVGEFNGYIFVKKDFLTNQLKVSNSYELRETDELEFILAKLNTITIAKAENGKVTVNKSAAAIEDIVELIIVPDVGYVVENVIIRTKANEQIELIDDYKFSMPDEPVTVTVVFNKLKQETEAPTIDKTEEVKDLTIGVSNLEEANKILLDTLANRKDLENVIKDKNIKVEIDVKEIEAPEEDKTKISKKLLSISENIKLSNFFDISIYVKNADNNVELGKLTELRSPMEFTVALPDSWQKVQEGYIRNIYIANLHDGEVKIIDNVKLSDDGKYATFSVSHFSTYAIAYEDVKDVTDSNVPKTGDNIAMYALLAIISVMGMVVLKKVNTFKSKH